MATSNKIRMSGMSSGLDTEALVKAMVATHTAKADTKWKDQQLMELRQEKWAELNKRLYSFYTDYVDEMSYQGTFSKTTKSVSNSSVLTLDSNITIPAGTYQFDVQQMAQKAVVSSGKIDDNVTSDTKLIDLGFTAGDDINMYVNGSAGVTKSLKVKDGTDGTAATTIADLEKEFSTTDVSFKFDSSSKAFIVQSAKSGADQQIKLEVKNGATDKSDTTLNKLGFVKNTSPAGWSFNGQNAKVTYNNGATIESASNQGIEIDGIKFNITGKGQTTVSSQQDTDGIVNFAKKFVEEYNTLIADLNKMVDADKNSTYMPLTSDEKSAMTESDIKLWEEKIEGSLYSGNNELKDLLSMMRLTLAKPVQAADGNGVTKDSILDSLGITAGKLGDSNSWKENGKLYLDEDKLRAAIAKDPDKVVNTLNGYGKSLKTEFLKTMKGTSQKSTNSFYNDIRLKEEIRVQKQEVTKLYDYADEKEDEYYKKFSAMETALSKLQSQQNALAGFFA